MKLFTVPKKTTLFFVFVFFTYLNASQATEILFIKTTIQVKKTKCKKKKIQKNLIIWFINILFLYENSLAKVCNQKYFCTAQSYFFWPSLLSELIVNFWTCFLCNRHLTTPSNYQTAAFRLKAFPEILETHLCTKLRWAKVQSAKIFVSKDQKLDLLLAVNY